MALSCYAVDADGHMFEPPSLVARTCLTRFPHGEVMSHWQQGGAKRCSEKPGARKRVISGHKIKQADESVVATTVLDDSIGLPSRTVHGDTPPAARLCVRPPILNL
jgi:hypothetical protein